MKRNPWDYRVWTYDASDDWPPPPPASGPPLTGSRRRARTGHPVPALDPGPAMLLAAGHRLMVAERGFCDGSCVGLYLDPDPLHVSEPTPPVSSSWYAKVRRWFRKEWRL